MKLIFEHNKPGKGCSVLPQLDVPLQPGLPSAEIRKDLDLPEVSEIEVIRHYTALSRLNFGVDNGFYPLGSCTMKYNPKIHERASSLPGFTQSHPYFQESLVQGNLRLMYELQRDLSEITGMSGVTLQPAAGAHGEITGLMIVHAYFEDKKEKRHKIIAPDSSHGTNPATITMAGFTPVQIKSNEEGRINLDELRRVMDTDTAALMLTNPNTLGIFEKDIEQIAKIVHDKGGLLYCDGANANAVIGISRFGDMGYDIAHLNLHKTFSTPHGGGGPGSGPVAVCEKLKEFLPYPVVVKKDDVYTFYKPAKSIGRIKAFYGNFSILVRAYAFIRSLGSEGIKANSENAVLNANYLKARLKDHFHMCYDQLCKHEFVIDDSQMPNHVTTMDIAKALLDMDFHPPTIYFPLIVKGAMMIEPTETETKETLDRFVDAMTAIKQEAQNNPDKLKSGPFTTPVSRLDEVSAARKPVLKYNSQT